MALELGFTNVINEDNLEEAASWIYDNMFGSESRSSIARDLVEDGRREVICAKAYLSYNVALSSVLDRVAGSTQRGDNQSGRYTSKRWTR